MRASDLRQGALAALLCLLMWPAVAGIPHEKAVPAYAEEQTILQVEQGLPQPGLGDAGSGIGHEDRHTILPPGLQPEYGVILQRGGNSWRVWRNGPLATLGAVLLLGTVAVLALLHLLRRPGHAAAPSRADEPDVLRFTRRQRWVHWAAAIAFVVLGLTGLLLLYGKTLVLPWLGHDAFGWLALAGKWLHNIAGPLFVVFTLMMFVTFWRSNRWRSGDAGWLLRAGGMFSKTPLPAGYFNAGEKMWFWLGVVGLGLLMAATGLVLNFPYRGEVGAVAGFTRYQLQVASMLHLVGAVFYMVLALGHIYLGTLGSPGAWAAMAHGHVSAAWARTHHRRWYEAVRNGSATEPVPQPAQGAGTPAPDVPAATSSLSQPARPAL